MKRYGILWPDITTFANLLDAAQQAQKGKRFRPNVLAFNHNLEIELLTLQAELVTHTYRPGPYRTFEIVEPKRRMISAAPYRDRVVHHALCNVIAPLIERSFIYDSYANRVGKGSHKALERFTGFARSSRYGLQCDIQKYFPSIDHAILKRLIRRKIKCPDTLGLIDTIIDGSNEQFPSVEHFPGDDMLTPLSFRRGLPIGNLTSQFFANVYLDGFDHFVKETLKGHQYLRYVDDFALFSDDRAFLVKARQGMEDYLATLRLKVHPIKSQIVETCHGASFLGFRVLPRQIRVRSGSLKRARGRLKRLQARYAGYQAGIPEIVQSIQSWEAHLNHGNTWRLRRQIFNSLVFSRGLKKG